MEHMENYIKVIDLFENPLFINYSENHVYCFIFNAIVECVNLGSKEDVIIDFDGIKIRIIDEKHFRFIQGKRIS